MALLEPILNQTAQFMCQLEQPIIYYQSMMLKGAKSARNILPTLTLLEILDPFHSFKHH